VVVIVSCLVKQAPGPQKACFYFDVLSVLLDLFTPNIILPWASPYVIMWDMVSLNVKDNISCRPWNHITGNYIDVQFTWPLTPNSIGIIFLRWVGYMCDMVTLGGKGNVLETGNYISSSIASTLDLWTPNSKGNNSTCSSHG
jgi:hypothetical protein